MKRTSPVEPGSSNCVWTITLESPVWIPHTILFQELAGEAVLLNLETGTYFGLDPVGTRIWQLLQQNGQLQHILSCLLSEFDTDRKRLRADLLQLVSTLSAQGLLRLDPTSGSSSTR